MKILIISFSPIAKDPRVFRQIQTLASEHDVSTIGLGDFSFGNVKHYEIRKKPTNIIGKVIRVLLLVFRLYDYYHRFTFPFHECQLDTENSYDIIIANDVESLPFATNLKVNKRFVFDAHEYAPRQFENNIFWRLLVKPFNINILKKYLRYVDVFFTVSEGIAQEYFNVFGRNPHVLTNAREYYDLQDQVFQEKSKNKINLIHHGAASPSRKLENLIYMMDYLDERYDLTLMLVPAGSKRYLEKLKTLADKNRNIKFAPPVSMQDIVTAIKEYDIGVYSLPPLNFNQEYALPNKIFEFIQARLSIVIGPSKEMVRVVEKYKIGKIARSFHPKDVAEAIKSLSVSELVECKKNTNKAAKEINAEVNMRKFKRIIFQDM